VLGISLVCFLSEKSLTIRHHYSAKEKLIFFPMFHLGKFFRLRYGLKKKVGFSGYNKLVHFDDNDQALVAPHRQRAAIRDHGKDSSKKFTA